MYRQSFQTLLKSVEYLDLNDLKWNDNDGKHITDIISQKYTPNLQFLELGSNNLGVDFCQNLANALLETTFKTTTTTTTQFYKLILSSNIHIGDQQGKGIEHLAPCLLQIRDVSLRDISLTDEGCHRLVIAASTHRNFATCRNASSSPTTATAATTVSPALQNTETLNTTRLERLELEQNKIENKKNVLEDIVRSIPSLTYLSVWGNPIDTAKLQNLQDLCTEQNIELVHYDKNVNNNKRKHT